MSASHEQRTGGYSLTAWPTESVSVVYKFVLIKVALLAQLMPPHSPMWAVQC